jgi:hypothetical protein
MAIVKIIIIYKCCIYINVKGKDRHFIGNWRPISLLNTDLKIASAVIANRIKPLLPFIISDT